MKSFEEIKLKLANSPTLQYFDVNKDIVLQNDASSHGLGSVLL